MLLLLRGLGNDRPGRVPRKSLPYTAGRVVLRWQLPPSRSEGSETPTAMLLLRGLGNDGDTP